VNPRVQARGILGSSSFLKKRTKKLFSFMFRRGPRNCGKPGQFGEKFFGSFFKKELLALT
jgi:hypothetical protein